jgi:hypothetical protein
MGRNGRCCDNLALVSKNIIGALTRFVQYDSDLFGFGLKSAHLEERPSRRETYLAAEDS